MPALFPTGAAASASSTGGRQKEESTLFVYAFIRGFTVLLFVAVSGKGTFYTMKTVEASYQLCMNLDKEEWN